MRKPTIPLNETAKIIVTGRCTVKEKDKDKKIVEEEYPENNTYMTCAEAW